MDMTSGQPATSPDVTATIPHLLPQASAVVCQHERPTHHLVDQAPRLGSRPGALACVLCSQDPWPSQSAHSQTGCAGCSINTSQSKPAHLQEQFVLVLTSNPLITLTPRHSLPHHAIAHASGHACNTARKLRRIGKLTAAFVTVQLLEAPHRSSALSAHGKGTDAAPEK
jgi:hypothetical protein